MNPLYDLWRTLHRRHRTRTAVRFGSDALTYDQLDHRVELVAAIFRDLGLTSGKKVVTLMPNAPDVLAVFLACQKVGAVGCPLNPGSRSTEIAQLLDTLSPDAAVVSGSAAIPAELQTGRFSVVVAEDDRFQVARRVADSLPAEAELDDVATIMCTSGTTGRPKAAMLTHRNLVANVEAFRALLPRWRGQDWLEHEVFGNVIPLSHPYGLIMMALMPLYLGGTVVLLPPFTPSSSLKAIEEHGITFFGGVPSIYAMLNQYARPDAHDLSQCRYWICGGAPLPEVVRKEFSRKFGARISEGFGMLETSSLATLNFDEAEEHPGSVGPFAGAMKARITDARGKLLNAGEAGDLWLQGPNVMKGYYQDARATGEICQNGWLLSGDIGYLDRDGYLYLSGRSKDMIIVGGHNVYPREIENVLLGRPEVADAAVAAREDPIRGERIVAFVVPAANRAVEEKTLLDHCRRHLSSFKCPRQIRLTNEIPRNATGKVLRQVLSDRLA